MDAPYFIELTAIDEGEIHVITVEPPGTSSLAEARKAPGDATIDLSVAGRFSAILGPRVSEGGPW